MAGLNDTGDAAMFMSHSADDTVSFGRKFGRILEDGDVVALDGDLGAGKTQFVQGVGAGLGIEEAMTSPTFNIVFEYESPSYTLYHFDLYRLDDVSELEDIDFYALSDESSPGVAFIEWAGKFIDEMPDNAIYIYIEKSEDDSRIFHISANDGQKMLQIRQLCESM